MRNSVAVVIFALLLASPALGQKIDEVLRCTQPDKSFNMDIPEEPGHSYTLSHSKCSYVRGGEVAGLQPKSGDDIITMETRGGRSEWHGTYVETFSNGDKLIYRHQGSGTSSGNAFSGTDWWEVTGGTGKLQGYTGKGKCAINGSPGKDFDDPCKGELKPPKK